MLDALCLTLYSVVYKYTIFQNVECMWFYTYVTLARVLLRRKNIESDNGYLLN